MRDLNDYLKLLIITHEAIEHPSLQKFLEIDTNFNPNYEYESIHAANSSVAIGTQLPK